jgi:hypothetical protein
MQVFIIGSPLETARAMAGDTRRYNKQIIEVRQILDALNGAKAWSNHPCVLQYRGREEWLRAYKECLEWYVRGDEGKALWASTLADYWRPMFHTQEYFDNMKARLYTKDKEHYKQWAYLGTSEENWYWSQEQGEWRKYVNGKRI